MPICWDCWWGWPKPVADIYDKAVSALCGWSDPLHFGPSHIVWEDENFDFAEWCLEHFDKHGGGYTDTELAIVRVSLEELLALPDDVKCVEPDDYDGEHPENYPPPEGIVMVRR